MTRLEQNKKVEELETRLNQTLIERSQLKILEEENTFLRQQLDFVEENDFSLVAARVVGLGVDETAKDIVLNKGRKAGVIIGAPIVAQDKIIIGKVISVSDYQSIARLINDHNSQLAAKILNRDRTIGLISGVFGLGVKMELIPQTEKIVTGDIVVTSGMEPLVPPGLVIGTIDAVTAGDEDIFQEASLRSPVNFDKLTLVSIIIPKNK
jgi:rod shape-determining protein MreC